MFGCTLAVNDCILCGGSNGKDFINRGMLVLRRSCLSGDIAFGAIKGVSERALNLFVLCRPPISLFIMATSTTVCKWQDVDASRLNTRRFSSLLNFIKEAESSVFRCVVESPMFHLDDLRILLASKSSAVSYSHIMVANSLKAGSKLLE